MEVIAPVAVITNFNKCVIVDDISVDFPAAKSRASIVAFVLRNWKVKSHCRNVKRSEQAKKNSRQQRSQNPEWLNC